MEPFSVEKCAEAAFAARLQRMQASFFLIVAVCWTTHSVLQDIIRWLASRYTD